MYPIDNEERINKPSLSQGVTARLRRNILTGRLRPGERIDQAALAVAMGVSKVPIREALLTLAADGLVQIVPRRGAYVSDLAPDDILDHYVIFGRVAGLAAERAAVALATEDIRQLEEINDAMAADQNVDALAALNRRFHQIINRVGSTRRLRHVIRGLAEFLPDNFFEFVDDEHDGAGGTHGEHRAILDALRARDPAAARLTMEQHFEKRGNQARRSLEEQGFWAGSSSDAS